MAFGTQNGFPILPAYPSQLGPCSSCPRLPTLSSTYKDPALFQSPIGAINLPRRHPGGKSLHHRPPTRLSRCWSPGLDAGDPRLPGAHPARPEVIQEHSSPTILPFSSGLSLPNKLKASTSPLGPTTSPLPHPSPINRKLAQDIRVGQQGKAAELIITPPVGISRYNRQRLTTPPLELGKLSAVLERVLTFSPGGKSKALGNAGRGNAVSCCFSLLFMAGITRKAFQGKAVLGRM
ncbi:hypothetical protein PtA15_13A126 [Puccinia triticina]|uniref:Uncharacterized protein n=1 Tax=Puccinia triticina TaxID=208348 RepID=A0ABY7D206_9BASI|nr:uncharacterized protein PtA15_13A126 [Puccinia triticina]WAQ90727.1 hypothetical protein PtA15_13A126 [Puccinia triticina]